ncbi:hypothetical protein [Lentzea jiangxiensis]|uniref:Uncharacterized protein n=1 Tax=Lentzea jiangxiensis TaxID=641025 RepID=A0A1H0MKV4_9PSEU|nr:hypothetical protein [Lentzea jiangxiensis]SDO80760.1 hypothetical protein SAMN05421507_10422 [Lentzea jiangxiensis]
MSENGDKPAEAAPLSPNEPRYLPNVAYGDMGGVQAGDVNGDVNFYGNSKAGPEAELLARYASPEEILDAKDLFVAPGGFGPARAALKANGVVVLCGKGTGRTHAARRLLTYEAGLTTFAYLNRARPLVQLHADELEKGTAYLLDMSGTNDRPITDWDFEHGLHMIRQASCLLIVLFDHRDQTPVTAARHSFDLEAPPPVEVAQASLRRREDVDEAMLQVVKVDLASALEGASPDKAMFAARLAVQVHQKELDLFEALTKLQEEAADAVARWFEKLDIRGHAYSFAVALLENHPYEHVLSRGWNLDERIREAALPVDRNLRPRGVLEQPKIRLLHDIAATTEIRKHPTIDGQTEETIRFQRQDWAAAVFTHMWQQYPAAREILRNWMCDDTSEEARDAVARAIYAIVTTVPAREPLALVEHMASERAVGRRAVAVTVLVRLTENDRMRGPAEQAMRNWIRDGNAYPLWTVARVYSTPSPHRPPRVVLEMFTEIGKSRKFTPHNAVVAGVLPLLLDDDTQEMTLNTVVSWASPKYRRTGLPKLSIGIGLWVIGFYKQSRPLAAVLGTRHPDAVLVLLDHVLEHDVFGPQLLRRMAANARSAMWDADDASELVRLAQLISPDLDWWRRRAAVRRLCRRYPYMRSTIRRIFRTARRIQRSRRPQP